MRVVLRRPVVVSSSEGAIPFPAQLSVLHEGLRMSVPVGALLAPISGGPGPYLIRVMYAVPTSPLTLHYPYYSSYHHYPQGYVLYLLHCFHFSHLDSAEVSIVISQKIVYVNFFKSRNFKIPFLRVQKWI